MKRVRTEPEFVILAHEFLVHAWREPELARLSSTRARLSAPGEPTFPA
jgi:hypothetical protein